MDARNPAPTVSAAVASGLTTAELLLEANSLAGMVMRGDRDAAEVFTLATALLALLLVGFEDGDQQRECAERVAANAIKLSRVLDRPLRGEGA